MPAPKGNKYAKGNKGGRPTTYNIELCTEICNLVADGHGVIKLLKDNDRFPAWSTFRRWKRNNEELRTMYINAVQDKAEMLDEKIDEIWEGCRNGQYDPSTANVLVQTLKWKSSKYYPKMFGDRVQQDITVDKVNPVKIILDDGDGN